MGTVKQPKSITAKLNIYLSLAPYAKSFTKGVEYWVIEHNDGVLVVKDDSKIHHILSKEYLNENFSLNF